MACAAAAEGRDHQLPGGAGRGRRRHQQPGGSVGRLPQGAVLARAVHRARRLPGRSAEEVLPAGAGPGSAAALRVLHHLHRGRQGRRRRDRRAALHLRPGDARRRRARRPQGEGDAALGVGRARPSGRSPAVRSPVQCRRPRATTKGGRSSTTSIPPRSKCSPRARPSRAWRAAAVGGAVSVRTAGLLLRSIPIPLRARLSSTGRCRSGTPGRKSSSSSGRVPELILHGLGLCQVLRRAPQS